MNPKTRKIILSSVPYLFVALFATKLGLAWRLVEGADASEKALSLLSTLAVAFSSPAPSLHPFDLCIGLVTAGILRGIVYVKSKNAKKYRKNEEYGSARWGTHEDITPYIDPVFSQNVLLTQTERLTMNNRPKDPRTARNKNVLVVGGSGSGKTRFFIKPNLMQCHSSYVVTDPKGSILIECEKLLQREGDRIKVLNTISFQKSMGAGRAGDDFWVKVETVLYTAPIAYIHYEAPIENQSFSARTQQEIW